MVRVHVRERESALTFKSAPEVRVVRSESRAELGAGADVIEVGADGNDGGGGGGGRSGVAAVEVEMKRFESE
jgi:hypothetical protein